MCEDLIWKIQTDSRLFFLFFATADWRKAKKNKGSAAPLKKELIMNPIGFTKPRTIPLKISFTSESESLLDEQQTLPGVCNWPLKDA